MGFVKRRQQRKNSDRKFDNLTEFSEKIQKLTKQWFSEFSQISSSDAEDQTDLADLITDFKAKEQALLDSN